VLESTYNRLLVTQRLNRDWRPHLNIQERDFLSYLIDNSVCYGRDWLKATVNQIVDGTDWLVAIGQSRRTVFRVMESLKAKGVLVVKTLARRVSCFILNLKWEPDMGLPISKKQAARMAARDAELSPGAPEKYSAPQALKPEVQCLSGTPKKNSIKGKDSTRGAPRLDGAAVVKAIKERVRPERKADKVEKTTAIWRRAHAEGHPGNIVPVLGKKEKGQLTLFAARFPQDGNEMLEWVIINWRAIVAEHFQWMDRSPPPQLPHPGFLLRYAPTFAEAFSTRKRKDEVALMPQEEREYHELRDSGLTHDDTLLEIGKRRALTAERGKIDRDKADVARLYRALERDRQAFRRPVNFTPVPEEPPVEINHGTNPWENGGTLPDLSFGEWTDD
jgi:hypothetical protein